MIRMAICEDNQIHLEKIKEILLHTYPDTEISCCFTAETRQQLYSAKSQSYDIIFMDIELPELSGIHLSKKILQVHPQTQIIFITQYENYCSDVYETKHVYFIHKSKLDQYLVKAVEKALQNIKVQRNQYLTISWNRHKQHLLLNDIIFMERTLRTTSIYSKAGIYRTSEKLSDLIKRLNQNFVCCHRSYLINLQQIISFEDHFVILAGEHEVPISQKYKAEVREKFFEIFVNQ